MIKRVNSISENDKPGSSFSFKLTAIYILVCKVVKMTKLVISLLTGFATILFASSFKNCSGDNIIVCRDTCSTYIKICDCGEKSYVMGYEFVCISTLDCMLDSDSM